MAIEDAAVLTRALQSTDTVAAALQLYERNRIERTSRLTGKPPREVVRGFIRGEQPIYGVGGPSPFALTDQE